MKAFICIFMAVLLTNAPHIALAEVASEMIPTMIPTAQVVEEMNRAQNVQKIEEIVSRAEVRSELAKLGLSQDEVSKRLATLSDSEIQQIASQMDQARFGGDGVIGLLVLVALVLLIIFLAKRI